MKETIEVEVGSRLWAQAKYEAGADLEYMGSSGVWESLGNFSVFSFGSHVKFRLFEKPIALVKGTYAWAVHMAVVEGKVVRRSAYDMLWHASAIHFTTKAERAATDWEIA